MQEGDGVLAVVIVWSWRVRTLLGVNGLFSFTYTINRVEIKTSGA